MKGRARPDRPRGASPGWPAAAVDARLDGPFRQGQPVGDFLVRQLLDVPHHHRLAQRLRQFLQRQPQLLREIDTFEGHVRADLRGNRRQVVGVDPAVDGLTFLPHAAVVIDAQVPAHADQPGLEVGAAVERRERPEDLQEDVLAEIFGFVVAAHELVRHIEDLPPVQTDDPLPGLLVAGEATLDEGVNLGRRLGGWVDRCGCQTGRSVLHRFSGVKRPTARSKILRL